MGLELAWPCLMEYFVAWERLMFGKKRREQTRIETLEVVALGRCNLADNPCFWGEND